MGGSGLALSSDGTIIACGSWTGDYGGVYRAGYVKVYQYSDGNMSWTSLGSVLGVAEVPVLVHGSDHYNGAYYAGFGSAVDLSSDGLTLAVGSVEWSKNRGAVTVFTYDQTTSSDWTVRQVLLGAHKPGPIERWHAQPDQMGGRVSLSSDGNVLAVGAQNAVDPDSLYHHYNHGYVKVFLWDAAAGQYSQRGRTIWGAHRENFGRVLSLSSDGTVVVTRSWTSHRLYAFKFTGRDFVSYGNYIYKSTNFGFQPSISGDGTRLVVPNRDARKVEVYEVPPPPPTSYPTPLVPEAVGCFEQTSVYGVVSKFARKNIVDANPVQTCRSYCLGPLNKEDIQYMSFTCPRHGQVYCNCLTEGDLSGKSVASSALRRPDYECRGECRTFGAGGTICYDRSTDGSRVSEGCHGFLLNGEYLSEFEGYILGDGYRSMVYPIHQALFTPRSNVPTSSPTVSESPSTSVSPTVDAFTIFDWDEVEAMGEPYDASVPSDRDTRPVISVDGRFFAVASEFENDWAGAVYVYEWSDSGGRTLRDSLQGGDAGSRFGSSMAISDNGSVLAVGSCAHESNTGKVQIYQWNGSSYVQIGQTLVGDETGDYFGWGMGGSGLALSSDGTIIACGSWTGDYGGVYRAGYVKVYQYSDGNMSWTSLGSVLGVAEVPVLVHGSDHYNGAYYAGFGSAVDLSSDGLTLAVGSVEWSKNRGAVTVFTYDQTTSSDWTVRQVLLGAHKPGPIERWHAQPDQMGGRVSLSSDGNVLAVGAQNAVDPDSLHHHYNHGYVKVFLWDAAAGQYSQRGRTILGAHRENFGRVLSLSSDGTVVVTRSWTSHRLYAFKFTGRDFVSYGNYIYKSTNFGFQPSISGDGTRLVVPNRDARKVEVYEVPPPPTPFPTITPVTSMVAVEDHPKYGQPQFIHPATELLATAVQLHAGVSAVPATRRARALLALSVEMGRVAWDLIPARMLPLEKS
ncbi:hypothetical protein THAOC_16636 [Thalassiosira oceanica]|uniref:Uncharacterized protein n=1 Tax=Thalassiosira oceanica TaxID=159749 RepID=K0SCV3_THAOC|nr:hypothetical protein THAOC_16636 [Thalassiosira oceanica]|eukprot:EJK62739.1 hypothetical protein THAOC_16636 [Thalassiosira oceanica]